MIKFVISAMMLMPLHIFKLIVNYLVTSADGGRGIPHDGERGRGGRRREDERPLGADDRPLPLCVLACFRFPDADQQCPRKELGPGSHPLAWFK